MDPFRFRPTVVGLEDRLTPAGDLAAANQAIAAFHTVQPAMEWLWAHQNTRTVFNARSTLATTMANLVQTSVSTITLLAETRTELQVQQALDPTIAPALAPYVGHMTAGIAQVYTIGMAALKMGHDFGAPDSAFVPPTPPPPAPPPVDSSDAGMTDTIPDINASDFVASATGLKSRDIKVGEGTPVGPNDTVTVQYTGWLTNGTVFDSSRPSLSSQGADAKPLTSALSGLIKGWQEGVPGMKPGGIRQLVIPADLAYGAAGQGNVPPNADLVFEIKLISSTPPTTTA
jgi:FKBP-type peptidyl-prolyl cis-trans isomerase FkpA